MKTVFALVPVTDKGQLRLARIISLAKTREELDSDINKCYRSEKFCMAKGSVFEIQDYMKDKAVIKINYERVD